MGDCETLRPRLGAFDAKHRQRRGVLVLGVALALGCGLARAGNTGATWSEVAKWPDFEGGLWTAPNADGHTPRTPDPAAFATQEVVSPK